MSGSSELDAVLRFACKMVHSSNTDSAEKIRQLLDENIRLRYGAHRMLINTLPKHHLAAESRAPGSGIPTPALPPPSRAGGSSGSRRQSSRSMDSRASSMAKDSPVHIPTITLLDSDAEDEAAAGGGGEDEASGGGDPELVNSPSNDDEEDAELGTTDEENMKVSVRERRFLWASFSRRSYRSIHNLCQTNRNWRSSCARCADAWTSARTTD